MSAWQRVGARSLFVALIIVGCRRDATDPSAKGMATLEVPAAVMAYTSGTISRRSVIQVQLHTPPSPAPALNTPLEVSPFMFDPEIRGEARWQTPTELIFEPAEPLAPDQSITVTVALDALGVSTERLHFSVQVMPLAFEVVVSGLDTPDLENTELQELGGAIITSDYAENARVEKMLTATYQGAPLTVRWLHSEQSRRHAFVVEGIRRGADTSVVELQIEGRPLGLSHSEMRTISVPSLTTFNVLEARNVQAAGEGAIEVRFTDPLKGAQSLRGLITVAGHPEVRLEARGSIVRITSRRPFGGTAEVLVAKGITSTRGATLDHDHTFTVTFADLPPEVRFVGRGVVVPTTQGLTVPFETANLRGVTVEATHIPVENVPQFLQVNSLQGDAELRRVGRRVWRRTVDLASGAEGSNRWARRGLDLGPLVQNHPPGLYRIRLSFGPHQITSPCATLPVVPEDTSPEDTEVEASYWDNVPYDYWDLYQNRENPCHAGYYLVRENQKTEASRNVLVSDLGLIAKRGATQDLLVFATDLRRGIPLGGATIRVLDYQQQPLGQGTTGSDGSLRVAVARRPFLVLAEHQGQLGALRLDDGSALSVSHFDTGGANTEQGLKGFFYGERGVWRPGDDIYLTFILLDELGTLPKHHPVQFELTNSRGQLVDRATRTDGLDGFYTFNTKTDPKAPTGNYVARVRVGGATFEKVLRIETVRPNRLKLDLDVGTDLLQGPSATMRGVLTSHWLHGAPAKNLHATVSASLSPRVTAFKTYQDYTFDDPTRRFVSEEQEIFSGTLDARGQVKLEATLAGGHGAPGMLDATLITKVTEPGGDFSTDRQVVRFSPYERYVGIRTPPGDATRGMLLTDTKHPVRLVSLDSDGRPKPTTVEVKLYKVSWRWWWEKGEDSSLTDFVSQEGVVPLAEDTVRLEKGVGEWSFQIAYPEWGRFLILARDREGGHQSGKVVYVDWPGWAGRAQKDGPAGANVLSVTTDKERYTVGEGVTLNIPTGPKGRVLVSLENGSRVLSTAWVEPEGDTTRYRFTADGSMAGGIYAHVTTLQPHLSGGNDHPIRMYGVVPISIDDPSTKLEPIVETPDVFAPESKNTITIREAKGRRMTATVAVVDEGLLGLTRFQTPDPWGHFYARGALGVKTWDLYDDVVGAYAGTLETLLAIGGGDEAEGGATARKANRFPPVVRFYGPIQIRPGEQKKVAVDIPQVIGAVRVMVVAGDGRAFGKAEASVFIKKPLMVLASLPRVLGPGEEVVLPVSVFALDETVRQVTTRVETEGPVTVMGPNQAKLAFNNPGDALSTFRLKVRDELGIAKITLHAQGGRERATHTVELDVRHPATPHGATLAKTLSASERWQTELSPLGLPGTNTATLEISRVPPLNLEQRLGYLVQYPHGCVEQTVSKAFPQMFLSRLMKLDAGHTAAITTHVRAAIQKMATFQSQSGGFSYWPGDVAAHSWSTSYVGHFLLEAEREGYLIPKNVLNAWVNHQKDAARRWRGDEDRGDLVQAYRLYTLALANQPDLASMNRLENRDLSLAARYRLAAAYQLAGQPEQAKALITSKSITIPPYRELDNTFGSDLRDKAMILETLVLMNAHRDQRGNDVQRLLEDISAALGNDQPLSTQSIAFALIAAARFIEVHPPAGTTNLSVTWAGAERTVTSELPLSQLELLRSGAQSQQQTEAGVLSLHNQSPGSLFLRLVQTGLPPVGGESEVSDGLAIGVRYATREGAILDPTRLEQGSDLFAIVTVRNTGARGTYRQVALSHLVPSGWEIIADEPSAGASAPSSFDHRDVRDDRVYTYFSLPQGQTKEFRVRVNAAYQGRFYLPPIAAEAMYDQTIQGRYPGQWVEVVPVGSSG